MKVGTQTLTSQGKLELAEPWPRAQVEQFLKGFGRIPAALSPWPTGVPSVVLPAPSVLHPCLRSLCIPLENAIENLTALSASLG